MAALLEAGSFSPDEQTVWCIKISRTEKSLQMLEGEGKELLKVVPWLLDSAIK